jgi:hypothetical protein
VTIRSPLRYGAVLHFRRENTVRLFSFCRHFLSSVFRMNRAKWT